MKLAAAAFTDAGKALESRLGFPVERPSSVRDWTKAHFSEADALVFIGAVGIAVRAIAPHVVSKLTDPAVVALDEKGRYVIPLLSGHIGGANALAAGIAERIGAVPVVTTATDLNRLPAIDLWARDNGCAIENPETIKDVSAKVLKGESVGVMISERTLTPPFPVTLRLRPRTLIVGTGCKKGLDPDRYETGYLDFLRGAGVSPLSVKALATIDLKQGEEAMVRLSKRYALPLLTFSAGCLNAQEGAFAGSDFVKQAVGVDNVCERAAKAAGGQRLLVGKTAVDGMTFCLMGEEDV